ncbi:hypothetical protein AAC387_Pa03g3069 [Persea americana]
MHGPGAGILESSFSFSLAISLSYAQNCSLPSCCLPRGLLPMQEISERLSAVVIGWWFPPGLAWIVGASLPCTQFNCYLHIRSARSKFPLQFQ